MFSETGKFWHGGVGVAVLILVLVEYVLRDLYPRTYWRFIRVLILVLVEYVLRD